MAAVELAPGNATVRRNKNISIRAHDAQAVAIEMRGNRSTAAAQLQNSAGFAHHSM
jgi:hypothetical protein